MCRAKAAFDSMRLGDDHFAYVPHKARGHRCTVVPAKTCTVPVKEEQRVLVKRLIGSGGALANLGVARGMRLRRLRLQVTLARRWVFRS